MRTLKLQDNNLEEIKEECLRWYGAVILGSMEESIRRELLEILLQPLYPGLSFTGYTGYSDAGNGNDGSV